MKYITFLEYGRCPRVSEELQHLGMDLMGMIELEDTEKAGLSIMYSSTSNHLTINIQQSRICHAWGVTVVQLHYV